MAVSAIMAQVRCLQALTAAWQKLPQSAINAGVEFEDVSYLLQIGAVNLSEEVAIRSATVAIVLDICSCGMFKHLPW